MNAADRDPEPLPDTLADAAAEQLFAAAPSEREAVLAAWIAAHPRHEAELRRLGAGLAGAAAMLDATFGAARAPMPTRLGGHRVVRQLGEGAFGVVYLCRQEQPIVRDVAIKVLRPGAGDRATLRRFAAERQALATLNHPSITQVFDAGELPDGRPFVVMEYVEGATIRRWCEEHALPCRERLQLFLQLCRAVAHAHGRGIVHRDLKPANVLVRAGDDGPLVKVIDFGIAKALHADTTVDVTRTDPGRVIGTPGYMSPEQAAGQASEVDARADVFALGVMLYELLTGQLPWPDGVAATTADPERPSHRVRTTQDGAASAPRQWSAALRGDLDWITLKALARRREDRYATVGEFAADLERHLAGEAIAAGPPSVSYRLRKFVRRHRVAAAVLAGALAVGGSIAFAIAAGSSRDAERLADLLGVGASLMQRANDPALFGTAHGDAVRAALGAEAVRTLEKLQAVAPDDPVLQARRQDALLLVAHVHWLLGEPTPAIAAAREAARIAEALLARAPDDPRQRGRLGVALRWQGRAMRLAGHADAFAVLERAVEASTIAAKADPAGHGVQLAIALRVAGDARSRADGGPEAAARDFEQAIAILEPLLAARAGAPTDAAGVDLHEELISARLQLVEAQTATRQFAAATAELERILVALPHLARDRDLYEGEFHFRRALLAWSQEKRREAIDDFADAAAAAIAWRDKQPRRVVAHRQVVERLGRLGHARNYVGDFEGSSAAFRDSIAAADELVRAFPDDRTAPVAVIRRSTEFAYVLRERFLRQPLAEAAACVQRAIDLDAKLPAEITAGRTARWELLATLAGIEQSRGDARAPALWREVAPMLSAAVPDSDAVTELLIEACTAIARLHVDEGETEAAMPFVERARAAVAAKPHLRKRLVEVEFQAARAAAAEGDPELAGDLGERIARLRTTWFGYRRAGECHRLAWHAAGASSAAAKHRDRAAEYYRQVEKALAKDVAAKPDDPFHVVPWGFSRLHLAEIAAARDDAATAKRLLAETLPALEAVYAEAQLDEWDAPAIERAKALQARL